MNIESLDINLESMSGKVIFDDGVVKEIKGYEECQKYYDEIKEYERQREAN